MRSLTELILGRAAGKSVSPGDTVEARVDLAAFHDLTGYHVVENVEKVGGSVNVGNLVVAFDHMVPPPTQRAAEIQVSLRRFVRDRGVLAFHDVGDGILHQLLLERYAIPGTVVMGADSHTVTVGALGAFAQGLGASDVAAIMMTGSTWLVVPEPVKVTLFGRLREGVMGKDVALYILGKYGAEYFNGNSLEFYVEYPREFQMDYRATVANMGIEMGADALMFVPDVVTVEYIKSMRGMDVDVPMVKGEYSDEIDIELDSIEPLVAAPNSVDNVKFISEVEGVSVDYVFIGSCTNGRLSDIEVAARILNGRRVRSRCIVIPASRSVFEEALRLGYIDILARAGCVVTFGTCGPCIGGHFGIAGPDEVVLSTSNRNFKGRMGHPSARIYLANPAVAAASALEGKITDPRRYLRP
ncbi:MAG: 3-isopropylmalate dehydratase large subunit [Thermoprotei archaeon]